jgi:hypothetical protein
VVPPSTWNRSVPRDLERVCRKCLEKDPALRYATAAELAEDLGRVVSGLPVRANGGLRSRARRALAPVRQQWRILGAAALVLAAIVGVGRRTHATCAVAEERLAPARDHDELAPKAAEATLVLESWARREAESGPSSAASAAERARVEHLLASTRARPRARAFVVGTGARSLLLPALVRGPPLLEDEFGALTAGDHGLR